MENYPPLSITPSVVERDTRCPDPVSDDFVSPPVSRSHEEYEAFMFHIKNFNRQPEPEFREKTMVTAETLYSRSRWKVDDKFISRPRILEKIRALRGSSSPGVPYIIGAQNGFSVNTNSDFVDAWGEEAIVGFVEKRIQLLLDGQLDSDPVRLFIKNEPHKKSKAVNHAWRLIWSVSVIDQLIDALLFDDLLQAQINNHQQIPSKPGFSLYYGGSDRLMREAKQAAVNVACIDKQSWDWTVPGWLYDWNLQIYTRLCDFSSKDSESKWSQLAKQRFALLSCGKICFSDGRVFQQTERGIVRSGGKLTICMNSMSQVLLKIAATLKKFGSFDFREDWIIAQGDDTIENMVKWVGNLSEYKNILLEMGFLIKGDVILVGVDDLDFCSHRFRMVNGRWVPIPTNWAKHSYNLAFGDKRQRKHLGEKLFCYMLEYCFSDEIYEILLQIRISMSLDEAGPMLSRAACQSLVCGLESESQRGFVDKEYLENFIDYY